VRYFVITPDGNRYGPADIATLNAWIADSRLVPDQMLEEEGTGMRLQAGQLPGLNFAVTGPNLPPPNFGPGQTYQQYYTRPGLPPDDGKKDLQIAWICSACSMVGCCCCLGVVGGVLGLVYAKQAEKKGVTNVTGPRVLSIIGLVLFSAYVVFQVVLMFQDDGRGGAFDRMFNFPH